MSNLLVAETGLEVITGDEPVIPIALDPYLSHAWALLNAGDAEIGRATSEYPAQETEALISLLEGFRTMFTLASSGEMFADTAGARAAGQQFATAQATVCKILQDSQRAVRLAFAASPEGITQTWQVKTRSGLLTALDKPLRLLYDHLSGANPKTVFVCDYCGRIGASRRTHKRHCSNRCRAMASRTRMAAGL